MTDEEADAAKAALDAKLTKADPNVGIAFGVSLFDAFLDRKWFELGEFSVLGSGFLPARAPVYKRHYAFKTFDIPDTEFRIGRHA
jgi:hypothetical protein